MKKILVVCLGISAFASPVFASRSWFSPTRAQATPGSGMAMIPNFRVYNNAYTCADSFANVQASLVGNSIVASYRPIRDTGIVICPLILADYGPTFRLPALRPGYYEVYEEVWGCSPSAPLCELPAQVYLGLLAVANGMDEFNAWDMRPDTVDANTPFSLQILNGAYGNCHVGFSNTSLTIPSSGPITLSFTVEYYPQRLCLVDLHPSGPSYALSRLTPGSYPVYADEEPACMHDSIPCYPQVRLSLAVDTLIVRQPSSIHPGRKVRLRMEGGYPLGIIRGYGMDGRKAETRRRFAP